MTVEQLKQVIQGEWASIAPEIRPSAAKNADGSLKPFYLTRAFTYSTDDTFELAIINSADAYGKILLARIVIKGHIIWQGEHPIAEGAQRVKFIADTAYEVTPLAQGFANVLNQVASKGFNRWEIHVMQSILGKAFAPFGLTAGQIFAEYDLIYVHDQMLFWGARNVDGRGFDTEENRPTNLQIPLVRQNSARP